MGELSLDSTHLVDCSEVIRRCFAAAVHTLCGICFIVIPRLQIGKFCFVLFFNKIYN